MNADWDEIKIISQIQKCDNFFERSKLNQFYKLYYYTIFTKSEAERKMLVDEFLKRFKLFDSSNGNLFETTEPSFLPQHVRFLRIRPPDTSTITIAGDVLGQDLMLVIQQLNKLSLHHNVIDRIDNKILQINSEDQSVAIYFPRTHLLDRYSI